MNWTEIFAIVVPIVAFMGWVYSRLDKKFDEVKVDIKDLRKDVQSLDSRIARIEGQLMHMYPYETRWEPKVREKE